LALRDFVPSVAGGVKMQKISRGWLLVVALGLLLQAGAWSAVSVSWVDGGQSTTTTVPLTLITNPDWHSEDPLSQEPQFCWRGVLNINMVGFSPMTFVGTGNFVGNLGLTYPVRLEQKVRNNTNEPWTDFHLDLTGGVLQKISGIPEGWSVDLWDSGCDLFWDEFTPGCPLINIGTDLEDVVYINATTDSAGNGTFNLDKYPTYVPEAGTLAVLLSGGMGLLTYRIRRRKS